MVDEEIQPLSIGSIVGGTSPSTTRWREGIRHLGRRVDAARLGVITPLNVNVVFQVPGHVLKPDFEGVRTGRFWKKESLLLVQVALPEEAPTDVDAHLKAALVAGIDEAERWAQKRKLAEDLQSLRRLVDAL